MLRSLKTRILGGSSEQVRQQESAKTKKTVQELKQALEFNQRPVLKYRDLQKIAKRELSL